MRNLRRRVLRPLHQQSVRGRDQASLRTPSEQHTHCSRPPDFGTHTESAAHTLQGGVRRRPRSFRRRHLPFVVGSSRSSSSADSLQRSRFIPGRRRQPTPAAKRHRYTSPSLNDDLWQQRDSHLCTFSSLLRRWRLYPQQQQQQIHFCSGRCRPGRRRPSLFDVVDVVVASVVGIVVVAVVDRFSSSFGALNNSSSRSSSAAAVVARASDVTPPLSYLYTSRCLRRHSPQCG